MTKKKIKLLIVLLLIVTVGCSMVKPAKVIYDLDDEYVSKGYDWDWDGTIDKWKHYDLRTGKQIREK